LTELTLMQQQVVLERGVEGGDEQQEGQVLTELRQRHVHVGCEQLQQVGQVPVGEVVRVRPEHLQYLGTACVGGSDTLRSAVEGGVPVVRLRQVHLVHEVEAVGERRGGVEPQQ